MSASVSPPTFDPSVPLSPELRSDIAYRRAQGWSWKELSETLQCNLDQLRRAAEGDPDYARALKEARAEAQAEVLDRLRQAARGEGAHALKAAAILAKADTDRRRDEARLEAERIRAEAKVEVERMRTERAALKARASEEAEPEAPFVGPPREVKETEEEWRKRSDREHAERAAAPEAEVYLWGGRHPVGESVQPDESDVRVRVFDDWSCGVGMSRSVIYWIVPYKPPADTPPGRPDDDAGAAKLGGKFAADHPELGA